ncbi:MAG: hypothetical protein KDJ28_16555 [Candidatus Competibacteraceae bacterium]|nr:hypothetical protein [Candidatus Competibacteraceae bacterium]
MLQTIEVEVDAQGGIHPLQPLPKVWEQRALLTLFVPEPLFVQTDSSNIRSLFGLLKARKGVSLEAMDTAIREHVEMKVRL